MKKYICPNCESRNAKPYCNDCDCSIPNSSFIEEEEINYSHIAISNNVANIEIRCPSCDRKFSSSKKTCPYCGELLLNGTKYKTPFEAKEEVKMFIENKRKEQEERFAKSYGAIYGEVIIGGAVLYLIIHLLVKAFYQ